jgi:hypothetical protein
MFLDVWYIRTGAVPNPVLRMEILVMRMSEQFAGNYFKASDLPQPKVLTIQAVTQEKMPEGDTKPVMRFVGEQQMLVLNKTNAFCCVEMFGDETAAWQGRQVELYATTTSFSGRMVPCIRVRTAPQMQHTAAQPVYQPAPVMQQPVPQVAPQQVQPVYQYVQTAPVPQPQQFVQPQPAQQPPMQAPPFDYPADA